jgi:hypothetical protein
MRSSGQGASPRGGLRSCGNRDANSGVIRSERENQCGQCSRPSDTRHTTQRWPSTYSWSKNPSAIVKLLEPCFNPAPQSDRHAIAMEPLTVEHTENPYVISMTVALRTDGDRPRHIAANLYKLMDVVLVE